MIFSCIVPCVDTSLARLSDWSSIFFQRGEVGETEQRLVNGCSLLLGSILSWSCTMLPLCSHILPFYLGKQHLDYCPLVLNLFCDIFVFFVSATYQLFFGIFGLRFCSQGLGPVRSRAAQLLSGEEPPGRLSNSQILQEIARNLKFSKDN
jgi:hypothetical protein